MTKLYLRLALCAATFISILPVTYASASTKAATIAAGTVKSKQTITFNPLATQSYGVASFTLVATSTSGLPVSFTSSNPSVASVSSGKITIKGVGVTTIVASQAGNTAFEAATTVSRQVTVKKGNQTITFAAIGPKTASDPDFLPGATASSKLPITYFSSNTAVATIVNGKVHLLSSGKTDITATQSGNSLYNVAPKVIWSLTVKKADQTITFKPIPEKQATVADFAPNAKASSGLAVTLASSNTSVATIVNGKIHIVGTGVSTIIASQAGNTVFNPAQKVTQVLAVVRVGQKIYFPVISVKALKGADFDPAAKASSGLPVTYKSSNTLVATIVNGKVHIIKVGEAIITASQNGNNVYEPASPVSQALTVGKATQTITFKAIPEKLVGAPDFDLVASSSSGLKVIFTSSNTAVAKIVNGRVRILKSGLTNIVASQPGDLTYKPAPTVSTPLVVKKNKQTITFNAIPAKVVGSPDFNPGATASSGLPVTYKSSATVVATIVNGKVHIIKDGSSIITASQAGDDFYEAATIKTQKLVISKQNMVPELVIPAQVEDTVTILSVTESPVQEVVKTSDIDLVIKPGELLYKVYPNPASRKINVENEAGPDSRGALESKVWIRIYNSRGSLEKEVTTNAEKVTIPIENIREGSYVLRITNGKKEVTKHILIRH